MPLQILELGKQFRPATSQVYPPFKNGRYMEEYFYDYIITHKDIIESNQVYIPIFWTNLQNHPGFANKKHNYDALLTAALKKLPPDTKYFTVVQHDDGPQLTLPKNTSVFGACTGDIPLPLIYEDTTNKLLSTKRNETTKLFASFIGTLTHRVRNMLERELKNKSDVKLITKPHNEWTADVQKSAADLFIETTLDSKFCLAPRGYGRSSFRFFEAMLLDCVPVYVWDDIEWLPYMDILDYSKFSVSIQEKDIGRSYDILKSISDEKYVSMVEELKKVRHYFTLDGMSEYVVKKISN
jgi:hypothetical protein